MGKKCFKSDDYLFNLMPGSVCLEECKDGLECLSHRYRKYIMDKTLGNNPLDELITKLETKAKILENPDDYMRMRISPAAIISLKHEARGIRYSINMIKTSLKVK